LSLVKVRNTIVVGTFKHLLLRVNIIILMSFYQIDFEFFQELRVITDFRVPVHMECSAGLNASLAIDLDKLVIFVEHLSDLRYKLISS